VFFESLETRQLMRASLDPVTKVLTIQGSSRDALHGGDGDDYLISRDGTVDFLSGGSGIDTARDDVSDIKVGVERYIK
jgi:Ca2+-binding RTX toxin-like protein